MEARICDRCGRFYAINDVHGEGEVEITIFRSEDGRGWNEDKYWDVCPSCAEQLLNFMDMYNTEEE